MAAGAQRSYWRLGRRDLHFMAASFSNFSEDPNRRKEKDMSKCFESIATSVAALGALTTLAAQSPPRTRIVIEFLAELIRADSQ
jgi:hypothetical protein